MRPNWKQAGVLELLDMKIREDFADMVRRKGQRLQSLTAEQIAERCGLTPEEVAEWAVETARELI